ncbi:FAD-dependent monooxygenase [Arthrobacter tecti]
MGGGIAGLSAAASLLREGWNVTVLEQASRFSEVGAGLVLTANGLSALAALGLEESARRLGYRVCMAGTKDQHGKWLMRVRRTSAPSQEAVGIHRRELHRILLEAAEGARLICGVRVNSVTPGLSDGARAFVECDTVDGPVNHTADLVVGADGLRSALRGQLAPGTLPRYSGKSSWRGIVDDTTLVADNFVIRWGPGTEFGAVRISATQVYWYGYTSSDEHQESADEKDAALGHFREWAEPVPALIGSTPFGSLMRHNVYSLAPPLKTYVNGRTVLIGDAAHAMLPTMGQGANTSLEDGVCVGLLIGRAINTGATLTEALGHFDFQRRTRTQRIARRSHQAERFGAGLEGKLAVRFRNTVMKAVPGGPVAAAGGAVLSWEAPP